MFFNGNSLMYVKKHPLRYCQSTSWDKNIHVHELVFTINTQRQNERWHFNILFKLIWVGFFYPFLVVSSTALWGLVPHKMEDSKNVPI